MKKLLYTILLLLLSDYLLAQNQQTIDSLIKITKTKISDKKKVDVYVRLAYEYSDKDSANTVKYANKAIKLAKKINYTKGQIDALYEVGWVTMQKGYYVEAKKLFIQVIKESKRFNYPNIQVKALRGLSFFYDHKGNYKKALNYHFESLRIVKKLNNKKGMSIRYNDIGDVYSKQGNYELALKYHFKSLKIAKELKDKDEECASYNSIGLNYEYQGKYRKALDYHLKSLKIAKKLGSKRHTLASYNNIGNIYEHQGKYGKALDYHFKSLKIKTELEDKRGMGSSYNNIGIVYKKQGNNKKALDYYLKSLKIAKELGHKRGMSGAYGNIGNIYKEQGNHKKALVYHFKSLEIDSNLGNQTGVSITNENIGDVYTAQGNYEKALKYYFKSLEIAKDMGARADMSYPLIGIGKAYIKQKNWNLAQKHLHQSFIIAQETGLSENIRNSTELLALVEKELGNYKIAYEYQVLFKQMADSLQNKEQIEKITTLENEYQYEKEKQQKEAQYQENIRKQKIMHEAETQKQRVWSYFMTLALLLLSLITILIYRQYRMKKTINRNLQAKNEVIIKQKTEIEHKNTELEAQSEEIKQNADKLTALNIKLEDNNQELNQTLEKLQTTQSQLIHSEKMASLGQLMAGIAHEINTPLGVVKASSEIISNALEKSIQDLPTIFSILNQAEQAVFLQVLKKGTANTQTFNSREERKMRKELTKELEAKEISNAKQLARTLVDISISEYFEELEILINHKQADYIFEVAYHIVLLLKNASNIETASQKANRIVFALKSYTHFSGRNADRQQTNLQENVDTILTLYHNQIKQGIEVQKNYTANPEILAYPDELGQVWTNLIQNAIQAMNGEGVLEITISEENSQVLLKIKDSGKGIPVEIQDKIFEPFFTTKSAGEGSGLGLDIVRKIIDKHHGKIYFETEQDKGTTFVVELPN